MNLIRSSTEVLTPIEHISSYLQLIEAAGRTCYKSEDRITPDSADPFVRKLVCDLKHESVIEHCSISVRFIVDRGVSHELVRHRLASFSQESTRYCNYGKKGVTFIIPPWIHLDPGAYGIGINLPTHLSIAERLWFSTMNEAQTTYVLLLNQGWTPQQARAVLPNSLKTEVVMTTNLREWRHIFRLRTSRAAHPQMREVMIPLLAKMQTLLPVVFADITPYVEE